jgi:hypothetical protein
MHYQTGDIAVVPAPVDILGDVQLGGLAKSCVTLATERSALVLTDLQCDFRQFESVDDVQFGTLRGWSTALQDRSFRQATLQHIAEGAIDTISFNFYGIDRVAAERILRGGIGLPVAWQPLLTGYDKALARRSGGSDVETVREVTVLSARPQPALSPPSLRNRLTDLYQGGFRCDRGAEDTDGATLVEDAENCVESPSCIPAGTFLEELSQRLEIHPVSVYWLLKEGIEKEGWRCPPEEQRLTADRLTVTVLHLLGHRWPKQIEAGEPVPQWADKDGVIPISEGTTEKVLVGQVWDRIAADFPGGSVQAIENEFQEIMGESLAKWLAGTFFTRHISQFRKRPIAWQIQSQPVRGSAMKGRKKGTRGTAGPAFSCLVYYHKIDGDALPKIHSHYVGPLISKYQTELRTLESSVLTGDDGEARKWQLQSWIDELKAFDKQLGEISVAGFASRNLRQYAIDDAMLSLKSRWLDRLRANCEEKVLPSWQEEAERAQLHPDLPAWIAASIARLPCHCAAVSPASPKAAELAADPTVADLAAIISRSPRKTVAEALDLTCGEWWKRLDEIVFGPLRREVKELTDRRKALEQELEASNPPLPSSRKFEIAREVQVLKARAKELKQSLEMQTEVAKGLRQRIVAWHCQTAETWQPWLAAQPLYDQISSLDSHRAAPLSVEDWVRQESQYAPDINDGVRVNIAPLQKAGVLAADVLAGKDLDKAIADRADWRADERRWVREGKLPQPGWWEAEP